MVEHHKNFPDFAKIGDELSPSEHVEQSAEAFIYQLYQKGQARLDNDLNSLRYKLFVQPGKEKMLPPTKDSFHQHLLRANYHCCLWKHSLSIHEVDSPIGNGWIKEDNSLRPVLVTQQAGPMDLIELVRCAVLRISGRPVVRYDLLLHWTTSYMWNSRPCSTNK